MGILSDKINAGLHTVNYPYPGRQLAGIFELRNKGKSLCYHKYSQTGSHQAYGTDENGHPIRISLRYYECDKCKRLVLVDSRDDDTGIRNSLGIHW